MTKQIKNEAKGQDFRDEPLRVLMVDPRWFDIVDVKNSFMEGMQGQLDKDLARKQWEGLKEVYTNWLEKGWLDELIVLEPTPDCEDMVFAANQSFPFLNKEGKPAVIISKMRHPSRQREVQAFRDFYASRNYELFELENISMFEGMGDTIPHPFKKLVYGGYGHRSDVKAYEQIEALTDLQVVMLHLKHPDFYHLDTCFVPLNEDAVMLCVDAFTEEGMTQIRKNFTRVYEIPAQEALATFCLNAHVIHNKNAAGKMAVLQHGSVHALNALKAEGYEPVEIDTSEFMKSGGSVFCMKMMFY